MYIKITVVAKLRSPVEIASIAKTVSLSNSFLDLLQFMI